MGMNKKIISYLKGDIDYIHKGEIYNEIKDYNKDDRVGMDIILEYLGFYVHNMSYEVKDVEYVERACVDSNYMIKFNFPHPHNWSLIKENVEGLLNADIEERPCECGSRNVILDTFILTNGETSIETKKSYCKDCKSINSVVWNRF